VRADGLMIGSWLGLSLFGSVGWLVVSFRPAWLQRGVLADFLDAIADIRVALLAIIFVARRFESRKALRKPSFGQYAQSATRREPVTQARLASVRRLCAVEHMKWVE